MKTKRDLATEAEIMSHPRAPKVSAPGTGPPPPDDGDGHPPPPPLSIPSMAFQFKLPNTPDFPQPCLSSDDQRKLADAIRSQVRAQGEPDVEVCSRCVPTARLTQVGIWIPTPSPGCDPAKERGLARQSGGLLSSEFWSFTINRGFIEYQLRKNWDDGVIPHHLSLDGTPCVGDDCDIDLTGILVSFQPPNAIVTTVLGIIRATAPDVSFTLTTTDRLFIDAGKIGVDSSTQFDPDTTLLSVLSWLVLGAAVLGGIFIGPGVGLIGSLISIGLGFEMAFVEGQGPAVKGLGALLLQALIPGDVMLPGRKRATFLYSRVSVDGANVTAAGIPLISERTNPRVTIVGPTGATAVIADDPSASVELTYSIATEDLLPPLQVAWIADGTVALPTAPRTLIRFEIDQPHVGQRVRKRVSVTVTDADGLSAQAQVFVTIHVIREREPPRPPRNG